MERKHLQNAEYYWSESQQAFQPIKFMAVPHVENAMRKLEREHGAEVRDTPLWQALHDRITPTGRVVTDISPDGGETTMIRGTDGRFTGVIKIHRVTASEKEARKGVKKGKGKKK